MDSKARIILAATQSSMMVFMVTLVATYLNLGLRADFVLQWAKSYIVAWPIAAGMAYLVTPMARRFTDHVIGLLDGTA
jgi:hypothetical protein